MAVVAIVHMSARENAITKKKVRHTEAGHEQICNNFLTENFFNDQF